MSRIGKQPIKIPEKVKVNLGEGVFTAQGPWGTMKFQLPQGIKVEIKNGEVVATRESDEAPVRALHGTVRACLNNVVVGVSEGFKKELTIIGVGYRAETKGKNLVLTLGHSHPILFPIPEGITVKTEKQNIVISGADKVLVGEIAAQIRKIRPPEPYKGKGVRYIDEQVKRKEGKAAAVGGTGAA